MTAERDGPRLVEDVRLDVAGATDIGKARQNNEDQYLIARARCCCSWPMA